MGKIKEWLGGTRSEEPGQALRGYETVLAEQVGDSVLFHIANEKGMSGTRFLIPLADSLPETSERLVNE